MEKKNTSGKFFSHLHRYCLEDAIEVTEIFHRNIIDSCTRFFQGSSVIEEQVYLFRIGDEGTQPGFDVTFLFHELSISPVL